MSLPLDSDLLRAFLAVADTGSMTAGAERIGRTQSALSMQIRRLEDVVGTPLFDRLPRGVALTDRGSQLEPYARRVARLLDEAIVALRQKPLDGPLRIGIPEEYGETVLPRVLSDFAERHPEVEVTVVCDYSAHQLEALEVDAIDLAVIFEQADGTTGEVLCIDPTVWVTSEMHNLHMRRPLPIASYFRSAWCQDFAIRSLETHGIPYRVSYQADTSGSLRAAMRGGLAVAALSRSTIPESCRELTAADGFPMVDASRVVLKRNPAGSGPAAEALAQMLRDAFRPIGPSLAAE